MPSNRSQHLVQFAHPELAGEASLNESNISTDPDGLIQALARGNGHASAFPTDSAKESADAIEVAAHREETSRRSAGTLFRSRVTDPSRGVVAGEYTAGYRPAALLADAARVIAGVFVVIFACIGCSAATSETVASPWTQFVHVEGQPEPVPAQWLATPEGRFAHSIKIPNPVPKDSGYRKGMTSQQYFDHLCKTEAGEFIFKTVDDVEGFYFMRPPKWPTDKALKDRYHLEAPEIERTFQLRSATPQDRGRIFVNPPWSQYSFVEEPVRRDSADASPYVRVSDYVQDRAPMRFEHVRTLKSRYGLTWRGLIRPGDRELAIAGSEWIVIDLHTNEVLAVQRNFARSGFNRNTASRIWWLNALDCPNVHQKDVLSERFYTFAIKSLRPAMRGEK